MKFILLLLFVQLGIDSFAQPAIVQPQIHYVSKRQYEDTDWMKVGEKVLFQQQCTTELPPEVPNGIVFFENVYLKTERFSMAIEFKDTVIVSVTYFLNSKQSHILKQIGYTEVNYNGSATKGQWTYNTSKDDVNTVMVGDRKRIVVVQTINEVSKN
jgi:hypothetical protein